MYNTPTDEYFFWKNLIEDRQQASLPVADNMFELLALAELKMTQFLNKKHRLSECSITPAYSF